MSAERFSIKRLGTGGRGKTKPARFMRINSELKSFYDLVDSARQFLANLLLKINFLWSLVNLASLPSKGKGT